MCKNFYYYLESCSYICGLNFKYEIDIIVISNIAILDGQKLFYNIFSYSYDNNNSVTIYHYIYMKYLSLI